MRDAVGRHVKHVKCVLIRQQLEGVCAGGRGYGVFLGGTLCGKVLPSPQRPGVLWDGSCFLEGSLDFLHDGPSAFILSNGHGTAMARKL